MSYYPQYVAVIAHNTEQHCGFGSALHPKESPITPRGILPQFRNHCSSCYDNIASTYFSKNV